MKVKGFRLLKAFSQTKDELILHFNSDLDNNDFFVKALLGPSFSCLSFPETYQRTKRNSVDLFESLVNQKIIDIIQFINERAFSIEFENNFSLVFKLFGNRSNIVLFKDGIFLDMFHKKMKQDSNMNLSLDRIFDVTFEKFQSDPSLQKWFPTLRGLPEIYLESKGYNKASVKERWDMIESTEKFLHETNTFYVLKLKNLYRLSLLPLDSIIYEDHDILKLSNEFYRHFISAEAFNRESRQILSTLQSEILKSESYISKTAKKIRNIKEDGNYKQFGDVLMANLNEIRPHESSVKLFNFYTEKDVEIKLKPDLNPQKNAEIYYRKSKNQFLQIKSLENTLADRQNKLQKLVEAFNEINNSTSLKSLRTSIKNLNIGISSKQANEPMPYYERKIMGATILIGKNAKSNDTLLNTYSKKEDLWLHVKDTPGSHVIIKYTNSNIFPIEIIEKAAQLAAHYSKRKSETLVPVSYTPRKYVRKRKGDPPGMVRVDREKVILVTPANDPT